MAFYQLLLLLGALYVGAAPSDDCGAIDLRPQLGPPRDQSDTSWCYAHTSADLVSQATGVRVSAHDLATTFMLGDPERLRSMPGTSDYLKANPDFLRKLRAGRAENKSELTPHAILNMEAGLMSLGGQEDETILLANLKGLCRHAQLPDSEKYETNLAAIQKATWRELNVACENGHVASPIGDIEENLSRIMAHSFQAWVDDKCKPRVPISKPLIPRVVDVATSARAYQNRLKKGEITKEGALKTLFEEVNRSLDAGKAVAVGYSAYDFMKKEKGDKDIHGDHSSVIAARRNINGVCHYFVRNSFGQDCDDYKKGLQCEKQNGGVWVKAGDFKTLYSVISIR